MKDVVIYTTNYCPYCRQAERFLTGRGIPFRSVDVTGDDATREKLVELTGGLTTVPQIFIGDTPIGGYTDMVALHGRGGLEPMLHGAEDDSGDAIVAKQNQ
jgi:glutaredoxin 3